MVTQKGMGKVNINNIFFTKVAFFGKNFGNTLKGICIPTGPLKNEAFLFKSFFMNMNKSAASSWFAQIIKETFKGKNQFLLCQ